MMKGKRMILEQGEGVGKTREEPILKIPCEASDDAGLYEIFDFENELALRVHSLRSG
jgi:hypothetical protein